MLILAPIKGQAYQPDAPYLVSQKKNQQKWAGEDKQIHVKLAALEKRFGKKPQNSNGKRDEPARV